MPLPGTSLPSAEGQKRPPLTPFAPPPAEIPTRYTALASSARGRSVPSAFILKGQDAVFCCPEGYLRSLVSISCATSNGSPRRASTSFRTHGIFLTTESFMRPALTDGTEPFCKVLPSCKRQAR